MSTRWPWARQYYLVVGGASGSHSRVGCYEILFSIFVISVLKNQNAYCKLASQCLCFSWVIRHQFGVFTGKFHIPAAHFLSSCQVRSYICSNDTSYKAYADSQ